MSVFGLFKKKTESPSPQQLLEQALGEFELPSFPAAVMQTLKLLRDGNSQTSSIAKSVEANPALVVKVLQIVNSASYGMPRRIESINHAVCLLGRSGLESLVVALVVKSRLPNQQLPGFSPSRFWQASARRAALARALASLIHPRNQSEAFVAGLLQDMAVPLLASLHSERYGPLLEHWHHNHGTCLSNLEQSEFGWDHGSIGEAMAGKWGLPTQLSAAIAGHHVDDDQPVPHSVRLVSLIREEQETPAVEELVERCRDQFGLPADKVVAKVEGAFEEAQQLAALLN